MAGLVSQLRRQYIVFLIFFCRVFSGRPRLCRSFTSVVSYIPAGAPAGADAVRVRPRFSGVQGREASRRSVREGNVRAENACGGGLHKAERKECFALGNL